MQDGTRNNGAESIQSLAIAQELTARGWRVTPLIGKIPVRKGWPSEALSAADVQEIWTERPAADVGVVTGAYEYGGSGLLVIDLDVKGENGFASLAAAQLELGALPDTYVAPTPSGGAHLYFAYPDHTKDWTSSKAWRPGIDIRASGGQVAFYPGAGTVQPLPAAWALALKRPPVDLTTRAAFAPLDLSELTPAQVEAARTTADAEAAILVEQMREHDGRGKHLKLQDTATKLGSWLWLTHDPDRWPVEMLNACEEAHERNGAMDEWSGAKVWKSVLDFVTNGSAHPKRPPAASNGTPMGNLADYGLVISVGPAPVPPRPWTDMGNAERLVDHRGTGIRYALDAGQWLVYDETTGAWTTTGADTLAQRRAQETLEVAYKAEAGHYSDQPIATTTAAGNPGKDKPSEREAFGAFLLKSCSAGGVSAMVKMATSHPTLDVRLADFDQAHDLLNVANGTVDLRTGDLLEHSPSHWVTQVAPTRWQIGGESAPLWEKFLEQVQPDPEVRAYLARVVGYTLTGSIGEQKMFIHHGSGANGKSVFMDVLARVLGSYAQAVPSSTLLAKQGDPAVPNDIARMRGKRLLMTSETAAGRRLDGELVKRLTGGEMLSAREMRSAFFEFTPTGKVHLTTNHVPQLGADDAIARRLETIPWAVVVPLADRDPDLGLKLGLEATGILSWAVAGCLEWRRIGLATPEIVQQRTREHLELTDALGDWIASRLDRVPGAQIELTRLYADYRTFAEAHGERPMIARTLSEALTERGFTRGDTVGRNKLRVFEDVTLRPTALQQAAQGFSSGNPTFSVVTDRDIRGDERG